ncbi:AfsR/SARP family transcriptional regulator [Nocardia thailandica]
MSAHHPPELRHPDPIPAAGAGDPAHASREIVVGLLGDVSVRRDDRLVPVPGGRARVLLAALAVRPGVARSAHALIEDIWGTEPPRSPMNALHTQVSRLRASLPDGALEAGPAGYRLRLPAERIDLSAARGLAARAGSCYEAGEFADVPPLVRAARALWRGEPGADLPDTPLAAELRDDADHVRAELDRIELAALVGLGDTGRALPLARAAAAAAPFDESAHAGLMRLLAATSRTPEALDVFAAYRLSLAAELGTDPGPAITALNAELLRGEYTPPPGRGVRDGEAESARPGAAGRPGPPTGPSPASMPDTGGGVDLPSGAPASGAGRSTNATNATNTSPPDAGASPGWSAAPDAAGDDTGAAGAAHLCLGLRAAPNELLGRAADLAELERLIRRSRVTTVLGPGGTGKTRVAHELGLRVARSEPVVLVELAPVRADVTDEAGARDAVESAISATIGLGETLRDQGIIRPAAAFAAARRLREALSARPMLLILDNCEHLVDAAAAVVADLLGSCAQLTVVTTSRAPLAITAETVYPLAPLRIDAAGSPATALFRARARAVRPDVRLDPDTVARLCRTLDGLPLAIELAAARVRTMSVADIESRLEHRFALLRSGDRSAPARHRTLHAVIDWSWNLLDPDQQVTLRRLCRFPGGFTLAAAEAVAHGPQVVDVAAAIEGLVGQSLLTVLDDTEHGIRYRMLETVREFGEEHLVAVEGEAALVEDRMARWARDFALASVLRYREGDQVGAVLAVGTEADNLVAVLRAAVDRADTTTFYTVFPVVSLVWIMRGAHREFSGWAVRAVALAPSPARGGLDADLQMFALLMMFLHLAYLSDNHRALAAVRIRGRALLRTGIPGPALGLLAELVFVRVSSVRRGRLLAEGTRHPEPEVRVAALFARANVWENAGNVHGSTRDAQHALRLLAGTDVWGTSMVCQHLAQLDGQSGRYRASAAYYRRALENMEQLRIHEEVMESRCFLAVALIGAGDVAGARAELGFVLEPASPGPLAGRPLDDPLVRRNHRLATVAGAVAELLLAEGETGAGLRYYRRALELLGWPTAELVPGPGGLMTASAAIGAHVLHDRAGEVGDLVNQVALGAGERLVVLYDLPQVGAVACGVGSWLLDRDPADAVGLELLALAASSVARQDFPSMELARHHARHRRRVGADRFDDAVRAAGGTGRHRAARRILDLLETHLART